MSVMPGPGGRRSPFHLQPESAGCGRLWAHEIALYRSRRRFRPVEPGILRLALVAFAGQVEERAALAAVGFRQIEVKTRLGIGIENGIAVVYAEIAFLGVLHDPAKAHALHQQAAVAVEAGDAAHAGAQFHGVEGLGDEVVGAGFDTFEPGLAVVERREHDHRHFGQHWMAAQSPAHFEPVHIGHDDVQQNQVRDDLRGQRQRLVAVVGQKPTDTPV
jgi:hypothetical protein